MYAKAPGQKVVLTDPVVVSRGSTLEQTAAAVHKDSTAKLKKYTCIRGSGKHDGIMVTLDHILDDADVIELNI